MAFKRPDRRGQGRRDRLVAFVYRMRAEQRLVARTRRRIRRKQHDAGGKPVQPVQRRDAHVAETPHQPRQQSLGHVTTAGDHRQEMRLVDDDQMLIDVEDGFLHRQPRFGRHLAVVMNLGADPECRMFVQRPTLRIQYPSAREAAPPDVAIDRWKPCAKRLQHRCPGPGRQLQAAGGDAVDGGRDGHPRSLTLRGGVATQTVSPRPALSCAAALQHRTANAAAGVRAASTGWNFTQPAGCAPTQMRRNNGLQDIQGWHVDC